MKILFIGDIYGRPGRNTVKKLLKPLKEKHNIELVIANAENMRHGKGVSESNLKEMQDAGVDFFTSGNHVFKDSAIVPFLDSKSMPLLRPANYPSETPGKGFQIIDTVLMKKVLVINLMGRVYMPQDLDCPFKTADRILEETSHENVSAIFVDFHAEATSEKEALAYYLDGRVSAVIGTHTHVPTADEQILMGGTAFQSDAGMTGPANAVIGADKGLIISHFLTQLPLKIEVADGPTVFNAVLIEIDEESKKAISIMRVQQTIDHF